MSYYARRSGWRTGYYKTDIRPALRREDSRGTAPLSWNIVVCDVTALVNPQKTSGLGPPVNGSEIVIKIRAHTLSLA